MPTISKLEIVALIYRVPEGRAYGMARGLTSIGQASLLKLTTDDGVEGIGEASGPPSITKAYLDLIAPYFIGRVWNASGSHQDVNDHAHTNGG